MKDLKTGVTVWLQGGLGNQLFQLNAAHNVSREVRAPTFFSTASYRRDSQRKFACRSLIEPGRTLNALEEALLGKPFARNGSLRSVVGPLRLRTAQDRSEVVPGSVMVGYFQESQDVDAGTEDVVARLKSLRLARKEHLSKQWLSGRVAAHVRRGDYVSNAVASRTFGEISKEYYALAAERLGTNLREMAFFTDDVDYVVRTFAVNRNSVFGPRDLDELDSILLMSSASGLVIPNSTFSWWAAELMGGGAKVVAPANWFRDGRAQTTLARPHWLQIEN